MPNGFVGRAAIRYLGDAEVEQLSAKNSIIEAHNMTGRLARVIDLPHSAEEARTGSFSTGIGSSINIVANRDEYERVVGLIRDADSRMADCLREVSAAIEDMCQSSFVLPLSSPLCMDLSGSLNGSLRNFRSLTDEMLGQIRNFAGEIVSIG